MHMSCNEIDDSCDINYNTCPFIDILFSLLEADGRGDRNEDYDNQMCCVWDCVMNGMKF